MIRHLRKPSIKRVITTLSGKCQHLRKLVCAFWRHSLLPTQLIISASFIVLLVLFYVSNKMFWENTQVPRLKKAAETQAQILAESQTTAINELLRREKFSHTELHNALKQMLIVEDPAIGERFIISVKLELDETLYQPSVIEYGETCKDCFHTEILLTEAEGSILGLASYAVSGRYFQTLLEEMRPKIFSDSSLILFLVIVVWISILLFVYRLQWAKRQIEASDQAKTRFMANVTHELKTPLNAILGYTQLHRQDQALPSNIKQSLETIDNSASHLLMMINDILEYSRTNRKALKIHPDKVQMSDFLSSLVEMIGIRAKINNIDFEYSFDQDIPATIIADEKRLKQILLNLLGNAVKFTQKGRVTFSVSAENNISTDNVRLTFSIKDTGIGIDKKQIASIFLPFQQVDNPINRAEGSGLGLTISQDLLSQMGSKLRVKSSLGQGSEFSFQLSIPKKGTQSIEQTNAKPASRSLDFPEENILDSLVEQLHRQNILGVREIIDQLEQGSTHKDFIESITPYIKNYRFKQLLEWIEEHR